MFAEPYIDRPVIEATLERLPLKSLALEAPENAPAREAVNKAGILLFIPSHTIENWQFCVMRPVGARPELGPPPFQLPKGTRMRKVGGEWVDIREGAAGEGAEPLAVTALREGMEEVGLLPQALKAMWDAGPVAFSSASTGDVKWMWLFAAELGRRDGFLPPDRVAATTAARALYTLAEIDKHVRPDHASLIQRVAEVLAKAYNAL